MNRYLPFSLAVSITLSTLAIPLRAANQPRAGKVGKTAVLWTNEDLEKLRPLAVISIVGQPNQADDATSATLPVTYLERQDPQWYAMQAEKLREELERRQTQLSKYLQVLEDVRSLKEATGGINLVEGDVSITPEAGIEILREHVSETQSEIDDLEDLARRNDIEPGTLRGQ